MSGYHKINIEDLKLEYLGKELNWLTIDDVIRKDNKTVVFLCTCRCGNTCVKDFRKVISGHTKSCGCYKKSKEFSDNQRQYLLDHPEIVESSINKYHAWRDNYPDEVIAANEKHKQWFKNHEEEVKTQALNYSKWCKDNPDLVKKKTDKYLNWLNNNREFIIEKGKRHSEWHKNHHDEFSEIRKNYFIEHSENRFLLRDYLLANPEVRVENGKKHSQWYVDNPDKVKEIGKSISQYAKEHPDKVADRAKHLSQYYKDNPDIAKKIGETSKKWCNENPDKLIEKAKNYSIWYSNNPDKTSLMQENRKKTLESNPEIMRSVSQKLRQHYIDHPEQRLILSERALQWYNDNTDHSYLESYKDIIHPEDYEYSINHIMNKIRIKCPICGKYSYHLFTNVFVNSRQSLKYNRAPMCLDCKCTITSSCAEQEIADYISTFYNGECIKNSRNIITPLELDLYYPEKKIAIEFNGDYWHSDKFKDRYYHRNKYLQCCSNGVHLINIFENDWSTNSDIIKSIINQAFSNTIISNDKEVALNCDFYNLNNYLNNGYVISDIEDSFYELNGLKIYRAGVAHLVKS